ncbi:MAG: hypothetical protein NVS3B24_02440 [Candidatus Dormibacteria bacterium]
MVPGMKRVRLLAVGGLLLVAAARVAVPAAPAMYEGSIGPTEPYHYCSPPPGLASTNKQPTPGSGDLGLAGDGNQLGSHSTGDNQVLTFFPKGSLKAAGAARFHVAITPNCSAPPAPPAGNKLVGNAYDLTVSGQPGDLPVSFTQAAQVLLRTPPVRYTSVEAFYDGQWHPTQWGQQGDIANITISHAGTLAALDDGRNNPGGQPPDKRPPGFVAVVEIVLVAAAVGIVAAAIVIQRRRGGSSKAAPRKQGRK